MSNQAKRLSDCPAERLAQCRGVDGPVAAEDVRAVVEESVAFELKKCADGYGHGGRWCGPAYNCWLDLRDRKERDEDFERRRGAATQRSVVLPERKPKTELGIYSLEDEGYNACLDDIARLNK